MPSSARAGLVALGLLGAACYNPLLDPPLADATVVGFVTVDLDASRASVRTREAPIGNLVSDALLEYARRRGHPVDLALMNGGNIRFDASKRPNGIYRAGPFTRDHVREMLPFGNAAVVVDVTGTELRSIFERSVASLPSAFGQFLQVSEGVSVLVDPSQPAQVLDDSQQPPVISRPGSRVRALRIRFAEVRPNDTFRLVTNDFIAGGGDGHVAFGAIPASRKRTIPGDLALGLEEYLRARSPVTPVIESRIVIPQ